mgnify:CR=1 FL=1
MKGIERYIKTLDPVMQEKMRSCKTPEAAFLLAREEGIELPDEALDAVYGGCSSYTYKTDDYYRCNICNTKVNLMSVGHDGFPSVYYCGNCLTTKDPDEVNHYYNRYKTKN